MRSFSQPFTLGRAAHCDVPFVTRIVSGVHARVSFARNAWSVQDLDSRNGTYLNGKRVRKAALRGRGMLQLGEGGPVLEFSVGEAFADAPPPPSASQPAPAPMPSPPRPASAPPATAPSPPLPTTILAEELPQFYRANTFMLPLPKDWQDRTVYSLLGPLNDNLQHNITINVEPEAPFDTVDDYAAEQVAVIEGELKGCRVLKKESVTLDSGLPAYRAIFVWYPTEEMKIYQEQLYVLHDGTGYRLTATFTPKTRKLLGPDIERIMRGFTPEG